MRSAHKEILFVGTVCLVAILLVLFFKTDELDQKEHVKEVPIPIENVDSGESTTVFKQNTKNPLPEKCVTSESYEFLEEYKLNDHFYVHSQITLDDRHYKAEDLIHFRDLVLEAWARKFEITTEKMILFKHETDHSHVIYARTIDAFQDITNRDMSVRTVACLINERFSCFQSPTDNVFTMVLAPVSYHKSREGTTIPIELAPGEIFIIHEYVHWLSSIVNEKLDSDHINKKLWIKDDPQFSVQAIAYRLHLESLESTEAVYQDISPMLNP